MMALEIWATILPSNAHPLTEKDVHDTFEVHISAVRRALSRWIAVLQEQSQTILREGVERMVPVYWNEAIETIQPAALQQMENEALRAQLDYGWPSFAFY